MTDQSHSFLTEADRAAIANTRRVTVRHIARDVCAEAGHSFDAVMGASRKWEDVQVRDLVCYIARRNGLSFAGIGRALNRDHKTIIQAVAREKARRGEA